MKKIIFAILCAVSASLCMSCASTQFSLNESGPVALIAVNGNSAITWVTDDPDNDDQSTVLTTIINKTLDSTNPELITGVDRLDYAEGAIRQLLSEIAQVEVIDKDVVLKAVNYRYLSENPFGFLDSSVHATGYRQLYNLGAKASRMLMDEIGAKSLIIAEVTSEKEYASKGMDHSAIEAKVTLKIKMCDERGREVLNKEYVSYGNERVKVVRKIYDKDELVSKFEGAIDNAVNQFILTNLQ